MNHRPWEPRWNALPFSPCGRRWLARLKTRCAGRSAATDEGSVSADRAPHPPRCARTFSHKGRRKRSPRLAKSQVDALAAHQRRARRRRAARRRERTAATVRPRPRRRHAPAGNGAACRLRFEPPNRKIAGRPSDTETIGAAKSCSSLSWCSDIRAPGCIAVDQAGIRREAVEARRRPPPARRARRNAAGIAGQGLPDSGSMPS